MRHSEIDTLKGVAVTLMIFYHYYYVSYLMGKSYDIDIPIIDLSGRVSHNIFIFMAGLNLYLSYKKNKDKKNYDKIKNGRELTLIILGLIISLFTYFIFPDRFVKFGILHFMAVGSILSSLFVGSKNRVKIGIVIFYLLNYFINNYHNQIYQVCRNNLFGCFILGANYKYSAIDHFALIPNMITLLSGIGFGQTFYQKDSNLISTTFEKVNFKLLNYLGRESLKIYMIHWVILYILLKNKI